MGFGGRDPALSGMAGLIATRPEPLGRKARINRFGVDCGEGLEWQAGWEPGGEYTKTVVVKNVTTQQIKLKYRLPETKYFSMAFPETKKLSPGMTVSIPITFRPVKRERYDDVVEFTTDKGQFAVAVRALLPIVRVEVPEDIDFGYIPAKETAHKSFTMSNTVIK